MFERFTEEAISAVMQAQKESRRLGHNFVGSESLLLGLIHQETGVAGQALGQNGISIENARIEVEKIIGRGNGFVAVEIPFTPRAKRILELTLVEARRLGSNYMDTEHLLLGLLAEGSGVGCRVLKNLGISLPELEEAVLKIAQNASRKNVAGHHQSQKSIKQPLKVFLAHAKEDKAHILQLHTRLKEKGYQPWVDKLDLIPGQNWRIEIPKAIKASDVFIACLSNRSIKKGGYVQKEFRLALNYYAEQPQDTVYLIPLRLDECEIPALRQEDYGVNLRDIHWVDYWEEDGFGHLIRALEYVKSNKQKN